MADGTDSEDKREARNGWQCFVKKLAASTVGSAVFAAVENTNTEECDRCVCDEDVLNFLLNLEYLQATYYLLAVTGEGLSIVDVGDAPGTVEGGRRVLFINPLISAYAVEIAEQEQTHVRFLRKILGAAAVPRPRLDLSNPFNTIGQASFRHGFDPFTNDTNFLLGSYIFEDISVTAYYGALSLLRNRFHIETIAGLLAVEAHQAAIVRSSLLATQNALISNVTMAIAQTRSAMANNGNPDADDHGIGTSSKSHTANLDKDAIYFKRNAIQTLNIMYGDIGRLGRGGGFFPEGMSGKIS